MTAWINISSKLQVTFPEHRSGWGFALQALKPLHKRSGVVFDGFVERTHSWHAPEFKKAGIIPYTNPWVGFLHNPPNVPYWCDLCHAPKTILRRKETKESLKSCLGLFTLSEYMRDWLQPRVNCPVSALIHPTEIPDLKWSYRRWSLNQHKAVIALGYWLRKLHSIQALPTSLPKLWLVPSENAKFMQIRENRSFDSLYVKVGDYDEKEWVAGSEYDQILASNIGFVHLYDASACNSIIECIVRNTPILVNPIPAVVEYLGPDYPYYFTTLEEAAKKAEDEQLMIAAHLYLSKLDKRPYGQDYFRHAFEQSDVGRRIASTFD